MSEKSRVFGNNMRVYLNKRGMKPEELAERLGYIFLTRQSKLEIILK